MTHEESLIQRSCVKWFRYYSPQLTRLLIAIPNGYKTTISQARIAKAEGLMPGASDLILLYGNGRYFGLAIEMKTEKGRQSESQKLWQADVEKYGGYKYVICRSLDDFIKAIVDYVGR